MISLELGVSGPRGWDFVACQNHGAQGLGTTLVRHTHHIACADEGCYVGCSMQNSHRD